MPVTVTEFSLFPFLKERVIPVKIGVDKIVQVYLSVCPSQSDLSFRKICISNPHTTTWGPHGPQSVSFRYSMYITRDQTMPL